MGTGLRRGMMAGLLVMLVACSSPTRHSDSTPDDRATVAGAGQHQEGSLAVPTLPTVQPASLPDGEPLRVVATTSIVGDVVAQVGGEAITLTVLMMPGQDPHTYQASAQDLAIASKAHLIFVNGFDLEEGLLQDLAGAAPGVPLVPVSAGIVPLAAEATSEGEHEGDHALNPHVWFDTGNVIRWTHNVRDVLGQADPANAALYQANAEGYGASLAELERAIRAGVETIPQGHRRLVTNHDTLSYFAHAYGFEVIGSVLPGSSTGSEPSAATLSSLIADVQGAGVPAIFVESSVEEGLAEVVAAETGASVYELYTDALGPTGSGADSYIGMMRANLATLEEALGSR